MGAAGPSNCLTWDHAVLVLVFILFVLFVLSIERWVYQRSIESRDQQLNPVGQATVVAVDERDIIINATHTHSNDEWRHSISYRNVPFEYKSFTLIWLLSSWKWEHKRSKYRYQNYWPLLSLSVVIMSKVDIRRHRSPFHCMLLNLHWPKYRRS